MERALDALRRIGVQPLGYRSPSADMSPATLGLLEMYNFRYDSSLMADDFRPYCPRIGDRVSQQEPLVPGRLARLWELPIAFEFDDWVHFQFNFNPYRNGTSAPSKVLEIWSAEIDWMHTNVDDGILTVAMLPQVIGRGHRIAMLTQFIAHCWQYDDLTFARLDDVVARLGPPDVAVAAPAWYRVRPANYDQRAGEQERLRMVAEHADWWNDVVCSSEEYTHQGATNADTDEIAAVCEVVAEKRGIYITHLRSEAEQLLDAIGEAIAIGRRANLPVEICHLKAAGRPNWHLMPSAITAIEAARAAGVDVTADMYPYPASGTGLSAILPPWADADGKLYQNLADPAMRAKIRAEVLEPSGD